LARARDPRFVEAVKMQNYHVFPSPDGDCKGLYVSEKRADGFVVRELEGCRSTLTFSYPVVALSGRCEGPSIHDRGGCRGWRSRRSKGVRRQAR
jgi:hypothetical protein